MPFVVHRGVRLYWEEHGSGPPILMIMGLSFTLEMWHRLLPALAKDYRVIVFDNRGMGRSDVPKGRYSIPQMAADALAVLDDAGVRSAHVVGASMGGMIAQEIAIRHPERVQSLLLGCTSYGGFFSRWPDFSRRPKGVSWATKDTMTRERAIVPLLYADGTKRNLIEEDLEIRSRCRWTRAGFMRQFGAILLWNSYRRLPRIRAKTLVVHGDQDRLIPLQNGRVIAQRIPGAELAVVPDAGHVMMTDQPELCINLALRFLEQNTEAHSVLTPASSPAYSSN